MAVDSSSEPIVAQPLGHSQRNPAGSRDIGEVDDRERRRYFRLRLCASATRTASLAFGSAPIFVGARGVGQSRAI